MIQKVFKLFIKLNNKNICIYAYILNNGLPTFQIGTLFFSKHELNKDFELLLRKLFTAKLCKLKVI